MPISVNILNLSTLINELGVSNNFKDYDLVTINTPEGIKEVPFDVFMVSINQRAEYSENITDDLAFIERARNVHRFNKEVYGMGNAHCKIYRSFDRISETDTFYFITPKAYMILHCKEGGFTGTTDVQGYGVNLDDCDLINLILNSKIKTERVYDVKVYSKTGKAVKINEPTLLSLNGVGGKAKAVFEVTKLYDMVMAHGGVVSGDIAEGEDRVITPRTLSEDILASCGPVLSKILKSIVAHTANLNVFYELKDGYGVVLIGFPNGSTLSIKHNFGQGEFNIDWVEGDIVCTDEVKDNYLKRLNASLHYFTIFNETVFLTTNNDAVSNLADNILYTTFNPESKEGWYRSRKGNLLFIHPSTMVIEFVKTDSYDRNYEIKVSATKDLNEEQIFDALEDFLARSKGAAITDDTNTPETDSNAIESKPMPMEAIMKDRLMSRKLKARETVLTTIDALTEFGKAMRDNTMDDVPHLRLLVEELYHDMANFSHAADADLRVNGLRYERRPSHEGSYENRIEAMKEHNWPKGRRYPTDNT